MRSPARSRRPSWRRLATLPVAVVLIAAGVRMVTMFWFAAAGTAAYGDERFAAAATDFERLGVLGVVDRWRADLGAGASAYRLGDLPAAEASFAAALDDEPDRCDLRFDLAVTIEAEGDRLAAGAPLAPVDDDSFSAVDSFPRPAAAIARYTAALGVIAAGDCPSTVADDAGDRLVATEARLEAKIAALDDDRALSDSDTRVDQSLGEERGDSEQIDQLTNRNEVGAAQRDAAHDADTNGRAPTDQSNW